MRNGIGFFLILLSGLILMTALSTRGGNKASSPGISLPALPPPDPAREEMGPATDPIDRSGIIPADPEKEIPSMPIIEDPEKAGRYVKRDRSGTIFFTDEGMALSLPVASGNAAWGLHWKMEGARKVQPVPEELLTGKIHHFKGYRDQWSLNRAAYRSLRYPEILPGMDLQMVTRPGGVEYVVHAAPGWKPKPVRIRMEGVEKIRIGKDGQGLEMETGAGLIREEGLYCYQPVPGGGHRKIEARYASVRQEKESLTWSFALVVKGDQLDPSLPLVMDPSLSWSTPVGGTWDTGAVRGGDVAVDNAGMLYTIGTTASASFPTSGGFQNNAQGSTDAYVMKIDPSGPSIVWASYLGGSSADYGCGIAVDGSGHVYVTGDTSSNDLPNVNGFQPFPGGLPDAFVTKIDAAGWDLHWSSYLGGGYLGTSGNPQSDYGRDITLGPSGDIYVTGYTNSPLFPVTGAFQSAMGGYFPWGTTNHDAFVARIADGNIPTVLWASYLGGSGDDRAYGIDVDGSGNAVLTGETGSSDFPLSSATQTPFGKIFVSKVNAAGNALAWSTYWGTGSNDAAYAVAVDGTGSAYVTGKTFSSIFPVTPGAYQTALGGQYDAFVSKFSSLGSVLWSTYLGGSSGGPVDSEAGMDIVVDSAGSVTVTGYTDAPNFPTNGGFQTTFGGGGVDAFVTRFLPDGSALEWSSLLGGDGADRATGVARDDSGNTFVAGFTWSSNFPVTPGGWASGGGGDGFLVQVSGADLLPPLPPTSVWGSPNPGNSGTPVIDWSGATDPGGSGIVSYDIRRSANNGLSWMTAGTLVSGSPWTQTPALWEGSYLYQVRAHDAAGNIGNWSSSSAPVIVDMTPPDGTVLINSGITGTSTVLVTLALSASDTFGIQAMRFSNDGSNWSSWQSYAATASWTLSPGDGLKTVHAQFQDIAGNTGPNPAATDTILLDTTGPDTSITSGPASPSNATTVTFSFTSTETGSTFEHRLDGGAWQSATSPEIVSGLANGSHTYEVRATDSYGNVDPTPAGYTWTTDLVAPETTINLMPPNPSSSASAVFQFLSNEAGSTFERRLDGGAWQVVTSPETLGPLADGTHLYEVRATDPAGNADPTPATHSWTILSGDPETTIVLGPSDPSSSSGATFVFTSSQAGSSFESRMDGGTWQPATSPDSVSGLSDGTHTYGVRAIGPTGNVDSTPAKHTWTIDTASPNTMIISAPPNPSGLSSATFDFKSTESGSTFERRIDGSAWVQVSSLDILAGLVDGIHTYEIRAIDSAGNVDPTPASHTWTVDTVIPETTITSTPSNPSTVSIPIFTFSSNEAAATFERRVDGNSWKPVLSPDTLPLLSNGSHTYEVRAIDPAGNIDPTPASYTWTIDTVGPETTITLSPPNPAPFTNATFAFISSETGSTFERKLDGGAWQGTSSPEDLSGLADGNHTYEVRATDVAGNPDPTPASYTWNIDSTDPDTTITSAPNDPSNYSTATFAFASSESPSSFQRRLDGAAWQGVASPEILTGLADGNHSYEVRATDSTGNTDPTPAVYSWSIDTAAPSTPVLVSPEDGELLTETPLLQWSGNGDSYEIDLDGFLISAPGTPYLLSSIPDGTHTWRVRALDLAGNTSAWTPSRAFTLDSTGPGPVILTAPSNGFPLSTPPGTFAWQEADDPAGVSHYVLQLDEDPGFADPVYLEATTAGLSLPVPLLSAGIYYWRVQGVDSLGNEGEWSVAWSFTIPGIPGAPTLLLPFNGTVLPEGSVFLDWTDVPEAVSYEVEVAGIYLGSPADSEEWTPWMADGTYTWRVRAMGIAAPGPWTSWKTFLVNSSPDFSPPGSVYLVTPENGAVIKSDGVPFTWMEAIDDAGIAGYEVQVHGDPGFIHPVDWKIHPVSPEITLRLPEGVHFWRVRAVDVGGNRGPWSEIWSFTVQAPEVNQGPGDRAQSSGSQGESCLGTLASRETFPAWWLLFLLLFIPGRPRASGSRF